MCTSGTQDGSDHVCDVAAAAAAAAASKTHLSPLSAKQHSSEGLSDDGLARTDKLRDRGD
jgi:hypothetical protein